MNQMAAMLYANVPPPPNQHYQPPILQLTIPVQQPFVGAALGGFNHGNGGGGRGGRSRQGHRKRGGGCNHGTLFANFGCTQGGGDVGWGCGGRRIPQVPGTFHPQAPTFVPPNAQNIAMPFSNTVKSYANWNVCYSCGFDVEDGPTSVTCHKSWRKPSHQDGFTCTTAQEYLNAGWDPCNKGMHKSQLQGYWHGGVKECIANKCKSLISVQPLDPTQIVHICNDEDVMITMSNCSPTVCLQHVMHAHPASWPSLVATAWHLYGAPSPQYLDAITIATSQAIADTGAMPIFIMEGTPIKNIWPAMKQLIIILPDGSQVKSTHLCDITIPGLPIVLTGLIVPRLSIASLIGIRVLCEAGCKVVFTKNFCNVIYNNEDILRGTKDPSTDLWTLPINAAEVMINKEDHVGKSHLNPEQPQITAFTHSVLTRAKAVKFAHQSLCNSKISTLLKATRRSFLTGCPNVNEKLILMYLNPSPATAKGPMKRPQHGIRSTTPKTPLLGIAPIPVVPVHLPHVLPLFQQPPPYQGPAYGALQGPNLIWMDDNESIANVFCFGGICR